MGRYILSLCILLTSLLSLFAVSSPAAHNLYSAEKWAWSGDWKMDEEATPSYWMESGETNFQWLDQVTSGYHVEIGFSRGEMVLRNPSLSVPHRVPFTWTMQEDKSLHLTMINSTGNCTIHWIPQAENKVLWEVPNSGRPALVLVRKSEEELHQAMQELFGPYSGHWRIANLQALVEEAQGRDTPIREQEQEKLADLILVADFHTGMVEWRLARDGSLHRRIEGVLRHVL